MQDKSNDDEQVQVVTPANRFRFSFALRRLFLTFFGIFVFIAIAVLFINAPSFVSHAASDIQAYNLKIGQKGIISCPDGKISINWSSLIARKSINVACVSTGSIPSTIPSPTPMMTPLPTVSPTSSASVTPTSNGSSTTGTGFGVGTAGAETGINIDVFNQVKADAAKGMYDRPCTPEEHDKTQWHSLINIEKKCHYDHEHGDDPNYVNDIFGQPGVWFEKSGQSLSYPWQTFSLPANLTEAQALAQTGTDGQKENDLKHEGYFWVVRRNQNCDGGIWCITDFRLQFHFMSSHHNEVGVRFHSFSFEGRLCKTPGDASTCGIYRTGGWTDHGNLFVTSAADAPDFLTQPCWGLLNADPMRGHLVGLPSDTQFYPVNSQGLKDEMRCHKVITDSIVKSMPNGLTTQPAAEWWTHGAYDFRYIVRVYDPISNVDTMAPTGSTMGNAPFCSQTDPKCRWNNSIISAGEGYTTQIAGAYDGIPSDSNGDGRTDLSAGKVYLTRFGSVNKHCSQAGLDCIPLIVSNVMLNSTPASGEARYSNKQCETCTRVDHDLTPAGIPSWIQWFYKK